MPYDAAMGIITYKSKKIKKSLYIPCIEKDP